MGCAALPGYSIHYDVHLGLRRQALQWSVIVLMTLHVGANVCSGGGRGGFVDCRPDVLLVSGDWIGCCIAKKDSVVFNLRIASILSRWY